MKNICRNSDRTIEIKWKTEANSDWYKKWRVLTDEESKTWNLFRVCAVCSKCLHQNLPGKHLLISTCIPCYMKIHASFGVVYWKTFWPFKVISNNYFPFWITPNPSFTLLSHTYHVWNNICISHKSSLAGKGKYVGYLSYFHDSKFK